MRIKALKKLILMTVATLGLAAGGAAHAGSVFLTGHDVDLHDGQNGYDVVILDWLRGAGTTSAIAAASYRVGLIRSTDATNPAGGFVGGVLDGAPLWAGGVTTRDPTEFADAAAFSTFLGTIDVLVVASYTGCGGCDLSAGDSGVLNGFASEIATAFNAGMDIFGNAGDGLATYYDFLPPGAVATGTSTASRRIIGSAASLRPSLFSRPAPLGKRQKSSRLASVTRGSPMVASSTAAPTAVQCPSPAC
jgi:hypothetical protein